MIDDDIKQEVNIAVLATDIKYIRKKIYGHCDDMKDLRKEMNSTNERVSSLESWRSVMVACIGLIGVLLTWGWLTIGGKP